MLLVAVANPAEAPAATANGPGQGFPAFAQAVVAGKHIYLLLDLSQCSVHGTSEPGPSVSGVLHFDQYMLQGRRIISFSTTHFTVRPDGEPVDEFLSFKVDSHGAVLFRSVFLNAATLKVMAHHSFDCRFGKGISWGW